MKVRTFVKITNAKNYTNFGASVLRGLVSANGRIQTFTSEAVIWPLLYCILPYRTDSDELSCNVSYQSVA
jgi:hypothetical protein